MDNEWILIVAEDPDIRDLYTSMLAFVSGARTAYVQDLRLAQRLVATQPSCQAIVVDVVNPSEWDACELFVRQAGAPPIVAVTGWLAADGRFRNRAFEVGCAACVAKPCSAQGLGEAVRRVMQGERRVVLGSAGVRSIADP